MAARVGFPGSVWDEQSVVGVTVPQAAFGRARPTPRRGQAAAISPPRDVTHLGSTGQPPKLGTTLAISSALLTSHLHYQLFNLVQRLRALVGFCWAWHQDARWAARDRDPRNRRRRAVVGDAGRREGDSLYFEFVFHVACCGC